MKAGTFMNQHKKLELIENILGCCLCRSGRPKIGEYLDWPIWKQNIDIIRDMSDKDFKNLRQDYIKIWH